MKELTSRQKKFIDEYLISGNGTQAAITAGYSTKAAAVTASKLLSTDEISFEISRRLKQIRSDKIAAADEILQTLTRILRGTETEITAMAVGFGKGARIEKVTLPVKIKERLKAAELLHKIQSAAKDDTADNELIITIKPAVKIDDEI